MFRPSLLAAALALLPATSFAQVHLSGPQTGVLMDTTYVVDNTISVPAGSQLTIAAGAVLLFSPSTALQVFGRLHAWGTEQDSIIFKPLVEGVRWEGIDVLGSQADSSEMHYCLITGSSSRGLYLTESGNQAFSHCTITDNVSDYLGGGVFCVYSGAIFDHCLISNNASREEGGGIECDYGWLELHDCVISNNVSRWDGGGVEFYSVFNGAVQNCLITGNISGQGGGVALFSSNINLRNCTIVNNRAKMAYGAGGIYGSSMASTVISSCILWGNLPYQTNGSGQYTYCDVQGGHAGVGNFNRDPLFVPGLGGDYYLSQIAAGQLVTSPCVDHGNPASPMITGTTRTDGVQDSGTVDMGYHYPATGNWLLAAGDSSPDMAQESPPLKRGDGGDQITASPNPFNPVTAISYQLPATSQVSLRVYDTAGRLISTLVDGVQAAGAHEVTFDGSELPSGLYLFSLRAGESTTTGKLVLVK